MSFYSEKEDFDGFSNWMKRQSREEMDHAYRMTSYIVKRGGETVINQVSVAEQAWASPLDAFEDAYKHECCISRLIDKLLDKAVEENNKTTQDLLWQFVREQVEEEAIASGIVDRIRRMGDATIFNLNQQCGSRMEQPLDM